jgi:dihydrofolate reductase
MGGASVYRAAIGMMDTLYITHVHTVVEEADAFFPEIDPSVWYKASVSETVRDEETGFTFEFVVYKKRGDSSLRSE